MNETPEQMRERLAQLAEDCGPTSIHGAALQWALSRLTSDPERERLAKTLREHADAFCFARDAPLRADLLAAADALSVIDGRPVQTEAERCRGYALLGSGLYAINHTPAPPDPKLGAELVITLATEQERSGNRQIGESRPNDPDAPPIQSRDMVIRIGFLSPVAVDAIEDQLIALRAANFPDTKPLAARYAAAPLVAERTGQEPPTPWDDRDDDWTPRILEAHPMETGRHDLYMQAEALVHNRNSKSALVELVHCLLYERDAAAPLVAERTGRGPDTARLDWASEHLDNVEFQFNKTEQWVCMEWEDDDGDLHKQIASNLRAAIDAAMYDAALPAAQPPEGGPNAVPQFDDPRVQVVYKLLCPQDEHDQPPPDEHWEGWTARRIVAALAAAPQAAQGVPREPLFALERELIHALQCLREQANDLDPGEHPTNWDNGYSCACMGIESAIRDAFKRYRAAAPAAAEDARDGETFDAWWQAIKRKRNVLPGDEQMAREAWNAALQEQPGE